MLLARSSEQWLFFYFFCFDFVFWGKPKKTVWCYAECVAYPLPCKQTHQHLIPPAAPPFSTPSPQFGTYVIIVLLAASLLTQVRFLNRGLQYFEALFVVPVYQAFWVRFFFFFSGLFVCLLVFFWRGGGGCEFGQRTIRGQSKT